MIYGMTDDEIVEHMESLGDQINDLEAKLAKAVRFMELAVELGRWDLNPSFRDEMINFTTELTRGKDD